MTAQQVFCQEVVSRCKVSSLIEWQPRGAATKNDSLNAIRIDNLLPVLHGRTLSIQIDHSFRGIQRNANDSKFDRDLYIIIVSDSNEFGNEIAVRITPETARRQGKILETASDFDEFD